MMKAAAAAINGMRDVSGCDEGEDSGVMTLPQLYKLTHVEYGMNKS